MNRISRFGRALRMIDRATVRVFACVAVLGLFAIGPQTVAAQASGSGHAPVPYQEMAESGFPAATYFRVTRIDMRLCPSPQCGGLFVERVNRPRTKCADGSYQKECYVAIVDFSALGLTASDEVALQQDFGARQALARGEIELVDVGLEIPTLVVTDAWRGATGTQAPRGRYWGVVPTGIVCITYPCPTLMRVKLNGRRISWLHGLDLSQSGATQEEIERALFDLYQGPGLLVFGRKQRITGPAGDGIELVGSEFFRKVLP